MQIVTDQFRREIKSHGDYAFPLLVSRESLSRYESGSFLWHWHPEIELTLITRGRMVYKVNRRTFHLVRGDILFGNTNTLHAGFMEPPEKESFPADGRPGTGSLPKNTTITGKQASEKPGMGSPLKGTGGTDSLAGGSRQFLRNRDCQYVSVTFDPRLVYGFAHSSIGQKYVEPVTQNYAMDAVHIDGSLPWHRDFSASVHEIIRLNEEMPDCYELETSIELQKLWKLLYLNRPPMAASSPREQIERERIKEILAYLEQHYMEKITLADISAHIHLCESECSRLFRRYMNTSLFGFLQEYRIERSLEYLADPDCTVTDAAARSGFSDPNYYTKIFVKQKGCTPRDYRKRGI